MLGEGGISKTVLGDDLLNHVAIVPHLGIKQNNDRPTTELSGPEQALSLSKCASSGSDCSECLSLCCLLSAVIGRGQIALPDVLAPVFLVKAL